MEAKTFNATKDNSEQFLEFYCKYLTTVVQMRKQMLGTEGMWQYITFQIN